MLPMKIPVNSSTSKCVPSTSSVLPAPARNRTKVVTHYVDEKKATLEAPVQFANQLEALRSMSTVVADTGELDLVRRYRPQDCTTNPSLVLKAMQVPSQRHFLDQALQAAGKASGHRIQDPSRPYAGVADVLAVDLGCELLRLVPGRISTEVDAHLSYDTQATVDKALTLLDLYAARGVPQERVYIKIASTWEGIQACRRLEQQGINCNMTLLFSFAQAAACADAGASLVSPFVGRILDWYKAKYNRTYEANEDPGVLSVKRIYEYYKTYNYKTIIMAASFRTMGEITELAGCDNITISPALLSELEACTDPLVRKLSPNSINATFFNMTNLSGMGEDAFASLHRFDPCGAEQLDKGISGFAADQRKLEEMLHQLAVLGQ